MSGGHEYDVMVTGAGPAGTCAAIGLRRLGYSVVLLERQIFPRPHIGESFTPGIAAILKFLSLGGILDALPKIESTGTLRRWEHRTESQLLPSGGGFVTDRGIFDMQMLCAAREHGIECRQHLNATAQRVGDVWQTAIAGEHGAEHISAHLWIDARGRQPAQANRYILTAPAAISLWAEFEYGLIQDPLLSRMEALHEAWLWGSTTAAGTYRVLAVSDPAVPRTVTSGSPSAWLREALARSTLLRGYADKPLVNRLGHCAAGSYMHADPWQPGFMKVGDAAFALDPLSSAGVEKAMRHALHCVVAAHTLLDDQRAAQIARNFYLDRLLESVANHACWTARHYGEAWPLHEASFWQKRAKARIMQASNAHELASQLATRLASVMATPPAEEPRQTHHPDEDLVRQVLSRQTNVVLSPMARQVETLCVVDSKAVIAHAISHPSMQRPVAFLDGIAVTPMLAGTDRATNLHTLVARWSSRMPCRQAMQVACWLLKERILVAC